MAAGRSWRNKGCDAMELFGAVCVCVACGGAAGAPPEAVRPSAPPPLPGHSSAASSVSGSSSSVRPRLSFFVSIVDVVVLGFLCVSVRRWRNAKRKQKRKRSHGDEEREEEEEEDDDDDDEDEDDNENGRRKNDNTSETTKGKTGRRGVASFVVVVDLHLFHVWNGKKKRMWPLF